MSWRICFFRHLGRGLILLGMFLAFPGQLLACAGDWCNDKASEELQDLQQGRPS